MLLHGTYDEDKLKLPKTLNFMLASFMAVELKISGKAATSSVSSSSGAISIGESYRNIKDGLLDMVICGGVDFNLNRHTVEGLEKLKAICMAFNDNPS